MQIACKEKYLSLNFGVFYRRNVNLWKKKRENKGMFFKNSLYLHYKNKAIQIINKNIEYVRKLV